MRVCWLLMASLPAAQTWAQATGQKFADPAVVLPGSGVAQVSQVSLGLLAVLALIFVVAWLMRRMRLFPTRGQAALQVLQGVNLGPKERAVIIKVQERRLLIGVAPGCVNLLAELSPVEESPVEPPSPDHSSASGPATAAPSFKSLLKRSMGLS